MKFIIILCIVFWPSVIHSDESIKSTKLADIFDSIKDKIPEHIVIPKVGFTLPKNKIITGSINLENVNITGIKEFQGKLTFLPTKIKLNIPNISVTANHMVDTNLLDISWLKLCRNGSINIQIKDVTLLSKITLKTLTVSHTKMNIGKFKLVIDGLLDYQEYNAELSEEISKLVTEILVNYPDNVNKMVEQIINGIIHKNQQKTFVYQNHEISFFANLIDIPEIPEDLEHAIIAIDTAMDNVRDLDMN